MVADLSLTEQANSVIPSIFFEKITVLNNYNYGGSSHIFDSIGRCDGFFNIVFTVANGVPKLATFRLEGEGERVPDISFPVLPLILQAYSLPNAGAIISKKLLSLLSMKPISKR